VILPGSLETRRSREHPALMAAASVVSEARHRGGVFGCIEPGRCWIQSGPHERPAYSGDWALASDRIKVAVVGAGLIGGQHAQSFAANPRAELVMICDADAGRAATVAA